MADSQPQASATTPNIVLTAGSVLRGDDAAGPMLSKMMEEHPIAGWRTIDGGQTPEDDIATIRRAAPARLVLVDAAAMGLAPGSVCRLTKGDVHTNFLMTTHSLPMTFLLGELEKACTGVTFVGIQPASTEFFDPLTPAVLEAVKRVYAWLERGADVAELERVGTIDGSD